MRGSAGRVLGGFVVAAMLLVASRTLAEARGTETAIGAGDRDQGYRASASRKPSPLDGETRPQDKPRESIVSVDDVLPWDAYLKIGRFPAAWSVGRDDDWVSPHPPPAADHFRASLDRTFLALEAGQEATGLRTFVSAAGSSGSGELSPRFTASAFHRRPEFGVIRNVVASASAGTNVLAERRAVTYVASSGFSVGPLSFLGHGAILDTQLARAVRRSWSARAQASWRLAGLLDTTLVFDWFDPNYVRPDDERHSISIGVAPVLRAGTRARVRYRMLEGPQRRAGVDDHELALELRVTF